MRFLFKSFLLIFTILINLQSLIASELVEVSADKTKEFQDSTFIKLMNKLNGGKIPYPFSNLLDSFGVGIREEGNVLFIPKGRSLVKEYANYHNPRIIVEVVAEGVGSERHTEAEIKKGKPYSNPNRKIWKENLGKMKQMGISDGDLYIGFAPDHKALEVISYNPKKPGFDFFVIENYEAGKIPKIVSNPALCLSCHQNEGPIFSRFPWNESLGDTGNEIIKGNVFDNSNHMLELIRKENPERLEIEGISLDLKNRFSVIGVSFFDSLVRQSNTFVSDNKKCEALCSKGGDVKCQQKLILEALTKSPNYTQYNYFKNIEKKINDIKIKSSMVPNRNPFTNNGFRDVFNKQDFEKFVDQKEAVKKTYGKLKKYDFTFDENVFAPGVVNSPEINDKNLIDPATLRPINSNILKLQKAIRNAKTQNEKISLVVNECLPLEQIKKDILKGEITPDILNMPSVVSILRDWPNTRQLVSVLSQEVKNKLNAVHDTIKCSSENQEAVLPVYQYSEIEHIIETINDMEIKKPQALFEKYCMQCHGGPNAFIKLPLDSLEKMANYIPHFSDKGIKERLVKKIMPPSFATLQPTENERKEMIKVIEKLKK